MSITAGDLYTQARARVGLNFPDGRLDDTNLDGALAALNIGIADLVSAHDWDWLYDENVIGVVSGLDNYRLPTDFLRCLWLANDTNEELSLRARRDAIRFAGQTGYPRYYSILGNSLYLSPCPSQSATYRIGYYKQIPLVAAETIAGLADTDLPIDPLFVGLATLYVAKNIAMMFKDYESYKMLSEEIKREMARVADNTRRSLGPMAPQTRRDGY